MFCEKCGVNIATTHIRTVVNGIVHEKHLCDHCAADDGYTTAHNNNFTQMLSSMFSDNAVINKNNVARCDCCGSTFSDIANSGKCGCAKCYDVFREQLLPYIKKSQYGKTTHSGKIPNARSHYEKSDIEKIEELKTLLKKLISTEQYEEAATVRDKIRMLEGEMQ